MTWSALLWIVFVGFGAVFYHLSHKRPDAVPVVTSALVMLFLLAVAATGYITYGLVKGVTQDQSYIGLFIAGLPLVAGAWVGVVALFRRRRELLSAPDA